MTIVMVRVPPDGPVTETLTDRRTGRTWTVRVQPFEIADRVVTSQLWNEVLGSTPPSHHQDLPKVDVSWRQAVSFCNRMSEQNGLAPTYTIAELEPRRSGDHGLSTYQQPAPDEWHVSWDRTAN